MRFYIFTEVNEQTHRLMVSNQHRPWTFATPEVLQVCCRPFRGLGDWEWQWGNRIGTLNIF